MVQRSSRAVSLALLVAATVWAAGLVVAPYALTHEHASRGLRTLAATTYAVGRIVCHQRPERSFSGWGLPLPVCARCAGLYAGAPAGALLGLVSGAPFARRNATERARRWLIVAAVPTVVTVVLEFGAGLDIVGWIRAAAAVPLAVVIGWVTVAGLRGDLGRSDPGAGAEVH